MKKHLLLCSLAFSFLFTASAQSLKILDHLDNNISGLTHMESGTPTMMSETKFHIENISSNSIDYKIKAYQILNFPNSDLQVCFGQACYTATAGITGAQTISGNGTVAGNDKDLTLKIAPFAFAWGGNTSATWGITAYDMNNPNDSVSTIITWTTWATGIQTISSTKTSYNAFPNPAEKFVSISYTIAENITSAHLVVLDVIGNEILQMPTTGKNGEIKLDVSSLSSGIYFYGFKADGKLLSSKKIVISK